ncbi:MAG TPA: ABC transporter ATP-binding protein [Chloroflexota bacterium]|nr:ABC transporter ATP-binding protein [Chloroflexota bacterium]
MGADVLLEVRNLTVRYGHLEALTGVDLTVAGGEIVAVIGANGAGKTTLLNAISGLLPIVAGEIVYAGQPIHGRAPQAIVGSGISQVPEGRQLFTDLTVQDNLTLGAYGRFISGANLWSGYSAYLGQRRELDRELAGVFELFPRLKERRGQLAGSLSGGEQQMLAIGRALMSRPKLLLLDEPSMGLAPLLVKEILSHLEQLRSRGLTILLVEQNANQALRVAGRAYALERGHVRISGSAQELLSNDEVRRAYLGAREFGRA